MKFEKFRLSVILPFRYAGSSFSDFTSDKLPGIYEYLEQLLIPEVNHYVFNDRGRALLLDEETAIVKVFRLNQRGREALGIQRAADGVYSFCAGGLDAEFCITEVRCWFFVSGNAYITLQIDAENLTPEQVLDLKVYLVGVREEHMICYEEGSPENTCMKQFTIKNMAEKLLQMLENTEIPVKCPKDRRTHAFRIGMNVYSITYGLADQVPKEQLPLFMQALRLNRGSGMVSSSPDVERYLYFPFDYICWAVSRSGLSVLCDCETAWKLKPDNVTFLRDNLIESVFQNYIAFYLYYLGIELQCSQLESAYRDVLVNDSQRMEEYSFYTVKKLETRLERLTVQDHIHRLFMEYLCSGTFDLSGRLQRLREDYQSLTMVKKYDTFISYRREGGGYLALLLCYVLRNGDREVFLDLDSMQTGEFDRQLYDVIKQSTNVIVVLSPGCLDHCCCLEEEDWMREEIQCAIRNRKNIIPIRMEGFEYPKELPDCMERFSREHSIACHLEDFDHVVKRLLDMLK